METTTYTGFASLRTGTLHRLPRCGVTRRSHLLNVPKTITQEDIDSGLYKLCAKCNPTGKDQHNG